MAFLGKVGSILRQTASRQITGEISASKPSIYQAIRYMSSSKIFVGGLSYGTDDQSLREAFGKYGYVAEARVIVDRETGRSRGFGFVTFSSPEEASSAIQALDGQDLHGRRVRVNYANDRPRGGGFGGGGFGGGGYGGGGYGGGGGGGGGYGGNYNNAYGAAGGGYGGNNAGYGGDGNYGSGGNYPSGFGGGNSGYEGAGNYGGGSTGGFNSSDHGVAGGGGGADSVHDGNTGFGNFSGGNSFGSGNTGSFDNSSDGFNFSAGGGSTDSGFDGNTGAGFGSNQFASDESAAAEDFDQDEPLDGNSRDEDDTDNFAKRA